MACLAGTSGKDEDVIMASSTLGGWLVHVMRESDGALSLEEALHVIMDSMKDYFPSQSVAVILIDGDTKELRIKISRQISYTFAKKFRRSGPGPTAERVVLEQAPLLLNSLDHESADYQDLKLEHDFASAVLAPIVRNQRGIGYIFADRAENGAFTESDLLHLQVVGYLVGNLIEKFDLIRTSKKLSQIDDASQALQYKAFVPMLATELERARTHNYHVALALMSIQAFRRYIETYGIDKAHELLAEIVGITRENIRDMDLLARFGADEFILCLSGTTHAESEAKLAALQAAIGSKAVGQGDAAIGITMGALCLESDDALQAKLQDILSKLGKCLVDAKAEGPESLIMESFV
jgi:diguanylate cyclase (GGDEF)-like protein